MLNKVSIQKLKERFAQQARARIPFNPVDTVEITGANVERLKLGMEAFGWKDYRFVTAEQAKANGWTIRAKAESVRITTRDPNNGSITETTLHNGASVRGMPSLEAMLAMSEEAVRKMRGEVVEPMVAEDVGVDVEDDIEIGPAREQAKSLLDNIENSAPLANEEVKDLFLDEPVVGGNAIATALGDDIPPEVLGQKEELSHSQQPEAGFAVMAPYWLDGLHNHDGVELAKQVNRLIESRKLEEDKAAIAALLNSYPDHRRLGLGLVPRSKYLTDPHLKANVSQPVQLLAGALVRDKEGAYRPKAGGMAVLLDQGTSLVLKNKTEQAYRGAMELALAKGWKAIELKGKPKMLAQAWLEAQMMGLQVVNYTPTEKDRERLAERMAEEAKKRAAEAKAEQQAPETVEVRPVVDAAGNEVMATVTYTVERVGQPPMEFGTPKEAAQAFADSTPAEEPVVTRTVTRVGGVVRSDVVAGVAKKEAAGQNQVARPDNADVLLDHEFEAALVEVKQEQAASIASDGQDAPDLKAEGRLLKHGPAPYDHNPNNKASYFVTLEKDGQAMTVWGKDLGRSIKDAGAQVGDEVSLAEIGRNAVEVEGVSANGARERKTAHRVSWATTVLSRSAQMAPPSAGLYIGPIVRVEDGRIAQKAGRDPGKLIWHDISKLQGKVPKVGEQAEINYAKGVGHIKEREQAQELGR
ncbi:hypothetical protein CBP36_21390 (plasmid) [Acidovorax carolinensis]|uniref:Uncharacterized protein n=1 Tax=Acidovorax carolinensis TaxID=553814 RepID=A0A240UKF2_9BURK|nr:LPD7 domain-containing protein [Acidovorax carolinensis]ART61522.1 hypothetical protein CBP36_21390 [Acidovorax carolinensis]